ncbi:CTP synthetase [Candidatus Mycoplasma haematolamae str. Purdue]|uniref:CTP synthase (glutamine hydrolyzing) n=1 Tax=Mycoplasma haematolamae (strain Purdue) TaxID=1212765 RepID=I7BIQ4_MYCHA|nr:CTP synthase [Candidatus Mycoplasma haematolamae]AFO51703.1 CTP synthetase [Candidatus Mycoplasma haematolamae str. Purdue]
MKIIFLTGGVYSSVGKGVMLSSIGKVLQFEGFRCNVLKFDPYLNYNSKFLSPLQHGEVFVTGDGEETDLDLGHYERFLGIKLDTNSCFTTGKIFHRMLEKERQGGYGGETVQIVPHLIQEIISRFEYFEDKGTEILLVELGGTVSDLEQKPFLLAAAQLKAQKKDEDMVFIHIAPVLTLKYNGEKKTKPIQHSISLLKEVGITPDLLILKGENALSKSELAKISFNFPAIDEKNILSAPYQLNIYEIPLYLYREEKLFPRLAELLKLDERHSHSSEELQSWERFSQLIRYPKQHHLKVGIIGKYSSSLESYYSIIQSLEFASYELSIDLRIEVVRSESLDSEEKLKGFDVIVVTPGFGEKSLDGMFLAIKNARENKVPFLGICFGMQLALIEYYRNVFKLPDANSLELDPSTKFPILVPWSDSKEMRLGDKSVSIVKGTKLEGIYPSSEIKVRHRNRYIFNKDLAEKQGGLKTSNLVLSAWAESNILEGIELKDHPFFVAVQYHPEFHSRPSSPEPLFSELLKAALKKS